MVRRFGQIIRVKPECIEEYERLHKAVWSEVLAAIHVGNMRNYSIFRQGTLLFAYFEYIGEDFEGDMQRMRQDAKSQEWWALTDPMQEQIEGYREGEWWTDMKEIFHIA